MTSGGTLTDVSVLRTPLMPPTSAARGPWWASPWLHVVWTSMMWAARAATTLVPRDDTPQTWGAEIQAIVCSTAHRRRLGRRETRAHTIGRGCCRCRPDPPPHRVLGLRRAGRGAVATPGRPRRRRPPRARRRRPRPRPSEAPETPEVAPATGRVLKVKGMRVNAPEGLGDDAASGGRSRFLQPAGTAGHASARCRRSSGSPTRGSSPIEEIADEEAADMGRGGKRLDDLEIDGTQVYHLVWTDEKGVVGRAVRHHRRGPAGRAGVHLRQR